MHFSLNFLGTKHSLKESIFSFFNLSKYAMNENGMKCQFLRTIHDLLKYISNQSTIKNAIYKSQKLTPKTAPEENFGK